MSGMRYTKSMDLPNLLSRIKTGSQQEQLFLAIEITANTVKTAVWQVKDRQTEMVSLGSIQTWESVENDDLLTAIDASLAEAFAGMNKEIDQVIFGLPETWVGEESIAESKKPILKLVCDKLGLKPVGFVVTTEAVVHYLQDTEGGSPSVILIHLSPEQVMVSMVAQGKLQGVQVVGRSEEIAMDVKEALVRFGDSARWPNRMILYDSKEDLEGKKQDLIAYDWQAKLHFLHVPQIEILPKETTITAVALSGGAEVAKSLGMQMKTGRGSSASAENDDQEVSELTDNNIPADMMEEFGFSEVEIDLSKQQSEDATELTTSATAQFNSESEGVVETVIDSTDAVSDDDDIKKTTSDDELSAVSVHTSAGLPNEPELIPVDEAEVFKTTNDETEYTPAKKKLALDWKFFRRLSLRRAPKVKSAGGRDFGRRRLPIPPLWMLIVVGVVIALIGGIVAYWNVPTAQMTIYLRPETLSKELTFTLDPNASEVDLKERIIPVTKSTVDISGTKQTPTTGSKTVGERAKGQVEIFNLQRSPDTLEAGTVIKSGSLAFTLNEAVKLASASAQQNPDFSVVIKPTSVKIAATAADIGEQYNIADGVQLTVSNYAQAEMAAKTVGAFSGGSARQIQAVAEADVERVTDELTTQLMQQIETEVAQKTEGQKGVIPAGEPKIVEEKYSAEVGDEATFLSLTARMNQDIYTYETKDVSLLGQQQVLSEIPEGFEMMAAATQIEVVNTKVDKESELVTITARVSIKLLPRIDVRVVAEEIKGEYPLATQEYLRTLPNYVNADVVISPSLPARLNTFPRKVENIRISVEGKEEG